MAMIWIAAHDADNAGDIVLLDAMRKILSFIDRDITKVMDWQLNNADRFNNGDCVVIGGGGLMIRDTKPNNVSGWRWNCPFETLKNINVPIVVLSVGLNRFRGQEDFAPQFAEHMKVLVDKSIFFGMREKASIERLRPYVGDLVDKIDWMPCPAAVSGLLYSDTGKRDDRTLVFAPAMDRLQLRGKLSGIIKALYKLSFDGWNIRIACHIKSDLDIAKKLPGMDYKLDDLCGKSAEYILQYYRQATVVIGMRLHSLLMPFGFGIPIIPIISHDKISDWLSDISHLEWGIELNDPDIENKIMLSHDKDNVDLKARWKQYQKIMDNVDYINTRLSL